MKHIDFTIDSSGAVKYDISGLLVQGENNVTRLTVIFPLEYEQFSKYIVFHAKRGVLTREGMVKNIEIKLSSSFFDLPIGFIHAGIEEIAFRAVDEVGTVFATVKTAFPPVNETLLPDSSAAAEVILTGTNFEAGENIEITNKQVDFANIIKIGLKRPLQNSLEVNEINGLDNAVSNAVNSKMEELLAQPYGIAGLDENGKLPNSVFYSRLKDSYTVSSTGIAEIEFTALDLVADEGEYEIAYELVSSDMNGSIFELSFNNNLGMAVHKVWRQTFFDFSQYIYETSYTGAVYILGDEAFVNASSISKGLVKLNKCGNHIFLISDCITQIPGNGGEYMSITMQAILEASNITSISIAAQNYEFGVGSKVEIRRMR